MKTTLKILENDIVLLMHSAIFLESTYMEI